MRNIWYKKIIAFGIIFLFIVVGFQPVFARITIKSKLADSEKDCECPINNTDSIIEEKLSNRIERLLNKVKIRTKLISGLFKHNSEIEDNCQRLSNKITELIEMKNKLYQKFPLPDYPVVLCIFLDGIYWSLIGMLAMASVIYEILEEININLAYIFEIIYLIPLAYTIGQVYETALLFNCPNFS
jgi:hypothetical protein